MKEDGSKPTPLETPPAPPGQSLPLRGTRPQKRKRATPPPTEKPTHNVKLTEEEAALKARKVVTVAEARVLFRQSIFTDEDLERKSGMGGSSVDRFWKGTLPTKGMAWNGIAGILESILVEHVIIKP